MHAKTLVSREELSAAMGSVPLAIVDCRHDLRDPQAGENAYLAGHIPGAVFAHLDRHLSDLNKVGAGTQQINYYGVPGTPILRGAKGGVFFNGMQRAYQRNEMPLSFGSVDAMDVVKGPAPAQYGPSQAGGYVAMIPKSPFFDRRRGSLRVSASDTGMVRGQIDQGAFRAEVAMVSTRASA